MRRGQNVVGQDPFISLKWHVELGSITMASFTECSGLTIETEVHEFREGGQNGFLRKIPGPTKHGNLVLKKGMCVDHRLFDWYKQVTGLGEQKTNIRKDVRVYLYDLKSQSQTRSWTLLRAFPTKWSGPDFRADQAAIAIEVMEFAFEGLNVQFK